MCHRPALHWPTLYHPTILCILVSTTLSSSVCSAWECSHWVRLWWWSQCCCWRHEIMFDSARFRPTRSDAASPHRRVTILSPIIPTDREEEEAGNNQSGLEYNHVSTLTRAPARGDHTPPPTLPHPVHYRYCLLQQPGPCFSCFLLKRWSACAETLLLQLISPKQKHQTNFQLQFKRKGQMSLPAVVSTWLLRVFSREEADAVCL